MKLIEMIIDEEDFKSGIHAISIVENPAIEENFLALNKEYDIKFAEVSKERKVLMGPALIPNKAIVRMDDEGEPFHIFFKPETIRKASELYLMRNRQDKATLEHEVELGGLCLVESWIIDDPEKDKSKSYGLEYPKGTWMVSLKVMNNDVWENYVKNGKVKGFSIEGYFTDAVKKKEADEGKESLSIIEKYLDGKTLTEEEIDKAVNWLTNG